MGNFKRLVILIHPDDNVMVTIDTIQKGEKFRVGEKEIVADKTISLGHKIARREIKSGEKIIKYGVSIGSATRDINLGNHVHVHNMKSDYISTFTLD